MADVTGFAKGEVEQHIWLSFPVAPGLSLQPGEQSTGVLDPQVAMAIAVEAVLVSPW